MIRLTLTINNGRGLTNDMIPVQFPDFKNYLRSNMK